MLSLFTLLAALSTQLVGVVKAQDYSSDHNVTSLLGTWSTGSGGVLTGPGFADPMNNDSPFIYPNTTGISFSFTDDGYFEEAHYSFEANGTRPRCAKAVVIWQHGKYQLHTNGSLTTDPAPFKADGRVQVQDRCAATSKILTYYAEWQLFNRWSITVDVHHATYYLQLYRFDGSEYPRLFLQVRPPTMLPTAYLTAYANGTYSDTTGSTQTRLQRREDVPDLAQYLGRV